ncbi:MAG TPA: alpha/beta hydrolase [Gemmatimonadales bacterium]|nr:alpha/beta hydrolase [Gemmatimonadales bacterium]
MQTLKLVAAALVCLVAGPACGGGRPAGGGSPTPGTPAPAAAPTPPPPPVPRLARVRGTELRFLERGTGIPVVFVHGSLGTLDSWQPQIDAFATRFRVIAYSRRYHWPNAAQLDGQEYSLSVHADDLIALIESLGLERVHLVGSSYGAYVALRVTLQRPDLVRSLVLAEPPILPWLSRTPGGDSLLRGFDATVLQPARRAFARRDSVEGLRRFWDGMTGRPGAFDALPEAARARLLRLAFELRLETLADPSDYLPALACKAVGGIRSPVLLVTGERSPRMFHIITDELTRCLPAEEIVTVPGAGHASHADNPAFYNAAVLRFLMRN